MQPLTSLQNSVCKPCISLHKDLDSSRENGKVTSGNKNVIVRSSYFMKKPNEETGKENESDVYLSGDNKLDTVVSEKTCNTEEKRITVRSPYFRPSIKQNANGQSSNLFEKYSFQTHSSELSDVDDDGESKKIVEYPKHRVRSYFFKKTSVNENHLSKDKTISAIAEEPHNNSHQGLSTDDSLECTAKKRKLSQTESPRVCPDHYYLSYSICDSLLLLVYNLFPTCCRMKMLTTGDQVHFLLNICAEKKDILQFCCRYVLVEIDNYIILLFFLREALHETVCFRKD